jgi:hypothetical protein
MARADAEARVRQLGADIRAVLGAGAPAILKPCPYPSLTQEGKVWRPKQCIKAELVRFYFGTKMLCSASGVRKDRG